MPAGQTSKFDASAAALGYLYQLRTALLRALDAYPSGIAWRIGIEAADDIEEIRVEDSTRMQLKHRAVGNAITDSSSDLWKTLRVWCTQLREGSLDTATTTLLLITTGDAPDGSVASLLLGDANRDPQRALATLRNVASGVSVSNAPAYEAFNQLSEPEQASLLERVFVLPSATRIQDLDTAIDRHLVPAVRAEHRVAFRTYLEGWWFEQSLQMLIDHSFMEGEDFDAFFCDLREKFLTDNLPISPEAESTMVDDMDPFINRTFVRQLALADISNNRVATAVRDYLRASVQRSEWTRLHLLPTNELAKYERRLVEEWEIVFNRKAEELTDESLEADKILAAKAVYAWAEDALASPIRSRCTEPFVIRGSMHLLAEELRVGWHPEYVARLMSLLEPVPAVDD